MGAESNKARGTQAEIERLLGSARIAVIGLSRDRRSYSRRVAGELRKRESRLIGVNRNADELDGIPCVHEIAALPAGIDGALILLPPEESDASVRQCLNQGITRIWVRGTEGRATVSAELAGQCAQHGVTLIDGRCPLMFLSGAGFPHWLHGRIAHWFGMWPR